MSVRYMLDTNILSGLMKAPEGPISKRIESVGVDKLCCSVIVAAELRYGAAKQGSVRLSERVNAVLSTLAVLPFSEPADYWYGQLRATLAASGTPIGPNDLFIAAHALSEDMVLVTGNLKEFKRVPDLKVENWLL